MKRQETRFVVFKKSQTFPDFIRFVPYEETACNCR